VQIKTSGLRGEFMKSKRFRAVLSKSLLCSVILTFVAGVAAPASVAQSTGGRIRGTVTDPSGGAVSAATVQLVN